MNWTISIQSIGIPSHVELVSYTECLAMEISIINYFGWERFSSSFFSPVPSHHLTTPQPPPPIAPPPHSVYIYYFVLSLHFSSHPPAIVWMYFQRKLIKVYTSLKIENNKWKMGDFLFFIFSLRYFFCS